MKVYLSLGSNDLIVKPETEFETDTLRKLFQNREEITGRMGYDGDLEIRWSGPASDGILNSDNKDMAEKKKD